MNKIIVTIIILLAMTISGFATNDPTGLKKGDQAPTFSGTDQFGKPYNLSDELRNGPVVLIFYRGHWCKYCNRYLAQLEDSLQFITDKGATIVAVTPEVDEYVDETSGAYNGAFRILADEGKKIMNKYKVTFEVDNFTLTKYKIAGIDLEKTNAKNGNYLPVPATYVINQEGYIAYAFFDPDYKNRAPISEIVKHLK